MKKQILTMMLVLATTFCIENSMATITFNNGTANNVSYFINDDVYVTDDTGGFSTTLNLLASGDIYGNLNADGISVVNVMGGTIRRYVQANDSAQINLSYGSIANGITNANIWAMDNSQITITGSDIGGFLAGFDEGQFIISGKDFKIDGVSVGYGTIINDSIGYPDTKRLYGILESGEIIDVDFALWGDSSILLIPEPTTLLLFGLGAVLLKKQFKKKNLPK